MTPLRVVAPGESAPKKRKMTITQAAAGGSLKDQLVALRERVAKAVEDPNCHPRDLAALSRRLIEIGKEIAAIEAAGVDPGAFATTPDAQWEGI